MLVIARLSQRSTQMRLRPDRAIALIGLVLCAIAQPIAAQSSAVLALPDGRTVEVIGLRRWTLGMLQDSLAKYAPTDSLQSHACAAILRYKLHFADAASTTYSFGAGIPDQIVVIVREPQDSARVHYRDIPLDTLRPRAEWRAITDVLSHHQNVFWPEVGARLQPSRPKPQYRTAADSALAMGFVTALRSFTRESDRVQAMRALATAPNTYDRAAAVLILANFADRDDSWWALVEALRESDGPVKGLAATVLVGLSRLAPRKIEWSSMGPSIHAMLDGTSLFVLDDLVQVLSSTQASPADARSMLGNRGGEMLLAFLASRNAILTTHSRALLTALRGADLGADAAPWRAWISTL
jgi:hypothetical protein